MLPDLVCTLFPKWDRCLAKPLIDAAAFRTRRLLGAPRLTRRMAHLSGQSRCTPLSPPSRPRLTLRRGTTKNSSKKVPPVLKPYTATGWPVPNGSPVVTATEAAGSPLLGSPPMISNRYSDSTLPSLVSSSTSSASASSAEYLNTIRRQSCASAPDGGKAESSLGS